MPNSQNLYEGGKEYCTVYTLHVHTRLLMVFWPVSVRHRHSGIGVSLVPLVTGWSDNVQLQYVCNLTYGAQSPRKKVGRFCRLSGPGDPRLEKNNSERTTQSLVFFFSIMHIPDTAPQRRMHECHHAAGKWCHALFPDYVCACDT